MSNDHFLYGLVGSTVPLSAFSNANKIILPESAFLRVTDVGDYGHGLILVLREVKYDENSQHIHDDGKISGDSSRVENKFLRNHKIYCRISKFIRKNCIGTFLYTYLIQRVIYQHLISN